MFRDRVCLHAVARYAVLYFVLVAYGAAYEYFYEFELTPLFHDMFTEYDPARSGIYTRILFLTPLAILPIGTQFRAAGQFIAGTLAILIFIPIPIVFVPIASVEGFWSIYFLLWIGYFIVCSLSSVDIDVGPASFTEAGFKRLLIAVFTIVGVGLLYVMATNRVQLVSLDEAHAARAGVTIAGLQGYLIPGYISSFGGLLIAAAIAYRRRLLLLLAVAGYLICYMTIEERTAAVMPLWIAFIYLAQRYVYRQSVIRYFLCIMGPFFAFTAAAAISGTTNHKSLFFDIFTLANYRVYSVSAISFNLYYNFFLLNPHTYWSHITVVSNFVSNPYGQPLASVMAHAYRLGNYNASFLETDGLAAAGTAAIPFICLIFGAVLVSLNVCLRRLDVKLLAVVTAGSSIALVDTGIGPGVLTNGLALLGLVLWVAPREPPWTRSAGRRLLTNPT